MSQLTLTNRVDPDQMPQNTASGSACTVCIQYLDFCKKCEPDELGQRAMLEETENGHSVLIKIGFPSEIVLFSNDNVIPSLVKIQKLPFKFLEDRAMFSVWGGVFYLILEINCRKANSAKHFGHLMTNPTN